VALLQISEPGQSPEPHQHRLAVGIDLGTTHSLVACMIDGQPQALQDENGQVLLPSVVRYLANGQVQVGQCALATQLEDAANTIASAKRLLGLSFEEATQQSGHLYAMQAAGAGAALQTVQGLVTPLEVSSQILRVLRERAETSLGGELVGAVITVPAYFDDAQRQATRDAARLAGLNVLRLINEPTAAALAYGLDHAAQGLYAVYDLGGGTFDLSILKLTRGVFEVIATRGDTHLGGDDFDALMVERILSEQAKATHTQATTSRLDQRHLRQEARRVREALSSQSQTTFSVTLSSGHTIRHTLSQAQFQTWVQALVQRTLHSTRQALNDAQLTAEQINGIVMVGGATRMPVIREAVHTFFGKPPLTNLDPDQVVALGAARQADLLAGNAQGADPHWTLLDVTPLSLGLETMGGLVERIIPRNSTIPVARAQEFTTFKDGQTAMSLHVVQGERELVSECRSLARFELHNIPPMTAGAARIRVTFQVDADGLLEVTAREQSTHVQAHVTVKPSYGLSDEEVATMLRTSMSHADADARERMLREQRVELEQLVQSVQAALKQDADLLNPDELATIQTCLEHAHTLTRQADTDIDTLRHATRVLSDATEHFAALRMDKSIRAALTGKSLNELN